MERNCDICGATYTAQRSSSRFCTSACRMAHHRGVTSVSEVATVPQDVTEGPVHRLVRQELLEASRAETWVGSAALQLAARIDAATAVMGYAALVKELRATMDVALDGVKRKTDPLVALQDELQVRRDRRRAG